MRESSSMLHAVPSGPAALPKLPGLGYTSSIKRCITLEDHDMTLERRTKKVGSQAAMVTSIGEHPRKEETPCQGTSCERGARTRSRQEVTKTQAWRDISGVDACQPMFRPNRRWENDVARKVS